MKTKPPTDIQSRTERYAYDDKQIEYTYWSTPRSSNTLTLFFLGVAQINELPKWVAEHCPNDMIVIQGAPLWNARKDGSDTVDFMFAYIKNVFEHICRSHDFDSINIIAESQSAPGTAWLFSQPEYNERVKQIVLVQPLGLTRHVFGASVDDAAKVLTQRARRNLQYQLKAFLFEPRHRHSFRVVTKHVDLKKAVPKAQFGSGLLYDASPDFKRLSDVYPCIVIVCGENDKLFPPSELVSSLERYNIPMRVKTVPRISHETFVSKDGLQLLREALSILG